VRCHPAPRRSSPLPTLVPTDGRRNFVPHSAHALELAAAEESAKKASLKVWEHFSELQEAEARAAATASAAAEEEPVPDAQKQVLELEVVEICDGAHFYCHAAGNKEIASLQQQLAASGLKDHDLGHKFQPGAGGMCMAKFSEDNCWYRAKVLKRKDGKVEVFFVDYGNKDLTTDDKLRPLEPTLSTQVISPQALECRLAHLVVADASDEADGNDAAIALSDAAWGKQLLARVEDRKAGVLHVTLFVDAQTNVNEELVAAGLARVEKTASKRALPLLQALQEKERVAKTGRAGMWKYGGESAALRALSLSLSLRAQTTHSPTPCAWQISTTMRIKRPASPEGARRVCVSSGIACMALGPT
jgi:staphylococcal nuclease domain-containing protein 1